MAEVRVTRAFKENFDLWSSYVISTGDWTHGDIEGLKGLLRDYELADGPDRLRDDLVHYTPEGVDKPSAINNPKDRFDYWDRFFASKAGEIRNLHAQYAGDALRLELRKAA